jgi:ABC-type phosphate transport system permease subunit
MNPAAAASLVVALGLGMTAAVYLRLRRRGQVAKATPTFWLMMVGMSVIGGVCVWTFATGRPGLGIGVLVGVYVVPELVLMPLRTGRSGAAAEAARSARKAGLFVSSHS